MAEGVWPGLSDASEWPVAARHGEFAQRACSSNGPATKTDRQAPGKRLTLTPQPSLKSQCASRAGTAYRAQWERARRRESGVLILRGAYLAAWSRPRRGRSSLR